MLSHLKKLCALIVPIVAMTITSSAAAEVPQYVRIRGFTYNGSGCPIGTVAENMAPDYTAFTLLFNSYIAEVGPNIPFAQKRKNCQINVDLDFPPGWSYSIFKADYRGYISAQPGVVGTHQAMYYFQGSGLTSRLRTNIYGPTDRNYQVSDRFDLRTAVWSPCGASRALNLNSEVRLDNSLNPRGSGLMTLDSLDGSVAMIYGLQWKRCR